MVSEEDGVEEVVSSDREWVLLVGTPETVGASEEEVDANSVEEGVEVPGAEEEDVAVREDSDDCEDVVSVKASGFCSVGETVEVSGASEELRDELMVSGVVSTDSWCDSEVGSSALSEDGVRDVVGSAGGSDEVVGWEEVTGDRVSGDRVLGSLEVCGSSEECDDSVVNCI